MSIHKEVSNIIEKTTKEPIIINNDSNFVVITYWWGSGKPNRNTARPCTSFYEDNLKKINKIILNILTSAESNNNFKHNSTYETIFNNLEKTPVLFDKINNLIYNEIFVKYLNELADYLKISPTIKNIKAKYRLIKDKFPKILEYNQLLAKIKKIIITGVIKNRNNLINLQKLNNKFQKLQNKYLAYKQNESTKEITKDVIEYKVDNLINMQLAMFDITANKEEVTNEDINKMEKNVKNKELLDMLKTAYDLNSEKEKINNEIIAVLKKKYKQPDDTEKNIFDLLIDILEYVPPIKFEDMIINWEKSCVNHGCNYLSVEYSEFTKEGGYQLAINAKPKFIKKALELCSPRSVLYIDGDMNIRKYPGIFDMKSVDYMARGWYIDPRSSWKMEESIMYDPYDFETSGGTMFFSSSEEANRLLNLWIMAAEKPINDGKADDRVLSLIFNTRGVMTWCNIIQLPIEYLWLTLDYDDRMMDAIYDYDKNTMDNTIIIDHPECLTSEDTATGSGAASSRVPKFSGFLEDLYPSVELTHEYIMFQELEKYAHFNEKILPTSNKDPYKPYFFWYYMYMGDLQYINDGNPDLIEQKIVYPNNPDDNEYPLTIVSYDDKYGNFKHPRDSKYTLNDIVKHNNISLNNIPKELIPIVNKNDNYIEIIPQYPDEVKNQELLQVIIYYLNNYKDTPLVYNPKNLPGYDVSLYNKLMNNITDIYKNSNFVFNPIHKISLNQSDYLKPEINLHQPMLFRYDKKLVDYLSMQLSLDDFSIYLNIGSYQFMSLVRVAYLLKPHKSTLSKHSITASGKNKVAKKIISFIKNYIESFETPLEKIISLKKYNTKKRRKKTRKINKITKRR